jgi:ABC-type lipoprotein release transport system permease subunit
MSILTLAIKSFLHYFKKNITIALGVAISTAVITGGLIVGDSVKYSLEQTVHYRLGNISHSVSAGDRFFTKEYAQRIAEELEVPTSGMLKLEGIGVTGGGRLRVNNLQVLGVDKNFKTTIGTNFSYDSLSRNEVVISENLAERLNLNVDDNLLLRIKKASVIPLNTPFVSDDEQTVSVRASVKAIAKKEDFGRFNVQNSQTAPFNVFMNVEWLNDLMELEGRINLVFISNTNYSTTELIKSVKANWKPEDGNFEVRFLDELNKWEFYSERVFIDEVVTDKITEEFQNTESVLTYFVNSFKKGSRETPYSFISTLSDSLIARNEIIVNEWLADDLDLKIGDSLTIKYFFIGPLRQLEERQLALKVKEIVSMQTDYVDESLMPFLPGLSDAGSCSEWETGIPIELEKIRDKDEDYWDEYRGTPKAFINNSLGLELWKNRFGNYTAIRFDADKYTEAELNAGLRNSINPMALNLQFFSLKEAGLHAAQNGVDFGQLFISLSFFILLSGIILTILLFVFHIDQRKEQIGTLSAIGFSDKKITRIYTLESLVSIFLGVIIGTILGMFYTRLVFYGLGKVWGDIVRTTILEIKVIPATVLIGGVSSIVVSLICLFLVIRRLTKREIAGLQKKISQRRKVIQLRKIIMILSLFIGLALIAWQLTSSEILNPGVFFMAGIILMIAFFLFVMLLFVRIESKTVTMRLQNLGSKNLLRNKGRSLSVVILLCIGTFLAVSTGMNRKDLSKTANNKSSGTGGFMYMAESTVPVLTNLNNQQVAEEFGFVEDYNFVQFRAHEGDDASCLNLNLISNPRILGVNPQELNGRFTFQTKTDYLYTESPWETLDMELENAIPAIADQTVIQWGLGKKVGDTLVYKNALGEEINLLLVGGLAGSIFQGNIIISNKYFLDNFPASSGSSVFLVDGDQSKDSLITTELNMLFRDYGWSMQQTVEKLTEFKSVENTYLTIFLVMGALGLLLGTIGAAIVLARNIQDRKQEIALLLSVGYKKAQIVKILFKENSVLLFAGILGGLVVAIISTLPSVMANFSALPFRFLFISILVIIINGLIWVLFISKIQVNGIREIRELRNE